MERPRISGGNRSPCLRLVVRKQQRISANNAGYGSACTNGWCHACGISAYRVRGASSGASASDKATKRARRLDNFDFEELAPTPADPTPILGPRAAE